MLKQSAQKVSGVYSGLRHILHPSFAEICLAVFFFCNPTDEPTNKQTDMGVNTTNSPTRSGGLQDDSCDKPPILFKQQV